MRLLSSRNFLLVSISFILLVGAYLRLHKIEEYLTFLGDEGRDVLIVKRMIVDHDFVLLGPTASVGGFFLGPMYYYFMAPFLWLWRLDPVGPAVMVALFGIATIYLVYHTGKQLFHPIVGLVSASLYALSPLVIAYSRSSWNPNLVPFFSLLLIYLLWHVAVHKKRKMLFIAGLVCGMGIQFHYLYSILILFTFLFIAAVSLREYMRNFFIWLAGFIVTFSPFLIFELRHQFPNTKALINFFVIGEETGFAGSRFFEIVGDVVFRSTGRLLFRMPNYEVWNGFPDWQISLLVIMIKTTVYVTVFFLLLLSFQYIRLAPEWLVSLSKKRFPLSPNQWMGVVLLFSWFVFSVILFGFYQRNIYDYYFGIFYPFPFLALGVIFWQLAQIRTGVILVSVLWIGLLYYNWLGRPFVYPPNKQLEQTKTIAKAALDMTGGEPYNFALITATNSDHAYRYFFEIWNRKPVTIEQPVIDQERTTVTDQLIVICENPQCHPLGNPLWEIAGFGRAQIAQEKEVFPVKIFKLVHYQEAE